MNGCMWMGLLLVWVRHLGTILDTQAPGPEPGCMWMGLAELLRQRRLEQQDVGGV